ncbi:hypothetical protein ACFPM0_24935 [Pseudonocardia sulfidoxydans]|uniref:hypothetical protein n=1 Tax=Pseudonocardia sulfidoxydans TaxID=54011 RepID=UPI00360DF3FA
MQRRHRTCSLRANRESRAATGMSTGRTLPSPPRACTRVRAAAHRARQAHEAQQPTGRGRPRGRGGAARVPQPTECSSSRDAAHRTRTPTRARQPTEHGSPPGATAHRVPQRCNGCGGSAASAIGSGRRLSGRRQVCRVHPVRRTPAAIPQPARRPCAPPRGARPRPEDHAQPEGAPARGPRSGPRAPQRAPDTARRAQTAP